MYVAANFSTVGEEPYLQLDSNMTCWSTLGEYTLIEQSCNIISAAAL